MNRFFALSVPVAVAGLVLAGCSSDKSGGSEETSSASASATSSSAAAAAPDPLAEQAA
jgi:iron uptake system component EfeO